jgi:hypothetical protein
MYKYAAAATIIGSALLMSSCSEKEKSSFSVKKDNSVTNAELQICGRRYPLVEQRDRFEIQTELSCEGEGKIAVHLIDGSVLECNVGYVTPGIGQEFNYVVLGNECQIEGESLNNSLS